MMVVYIEHLDVGKTDPIERGLRREKSLVSNSCVLEKQTR